MFKLTQMEKTIYFLYQHIRLDNNEIFYIGVGTKNIKEKSYKKIYRRAFSKSNRNELWNRIVNKIGYKVEILKEFDCIEICLKEETSLIDLYGRLIENTGKLTNIVRDNSEIEEKRLKNLKEALKKMRKKTYKYSKDGYFLEEYESLTEAALKNNTLPTDIVNCINGRNYLTVGFQWRYEKMDKILSYEEIKRKITKTIYQYDFNHNLIKEWESVELAAKELNIVKSALRNVLCGISISCKGYFWVYKKEDLPTIPYRLEVYDLNNNLIKKYFSLASAEKELNLPLNTISVYLQRNDKHYKYIFKDLKTKLDNNKTKENDN